MHIPIDYASNAWKNEFGGLIMIAWLRGTILSKDLETVVLDVQGVGYRLFIPLNTFYDLPEIGEEASLRVHTVVRADAIELFGFLTEDERDAFISLTGVAGIGPRLARNILSGIRPDGLAGAVLDGDGDRLRAIPGVGKRVAERILVELQDKVLHFASEGQRKTLEEKIVAEHDGMLQDVVSALLNLGYRKAEVVRAVEAAREAIKDPLAVQSWLKEALRLLSK
jgi:Holliday junction DNA helicase RuvA